MPYTCGCSAVLQRHSGVRLGTGIPAAHIHIRLVLLPSRPDTIHSSMLHRTHTSTSSFRRHAICTDATAQKEFSPA